MAELGLDIARLLTTPEGQYSERKSLWDLSRDGRVPLNRRAVRDLIAKHVAAFANADGGVLILGADDDGTPSGHGYPAEVVDAMLNVPGERLRPQQPAGTRVAHMGHELLVFSVDAAPSAVMVEGDGFPRRVGDAVVAERQSDIDAIKQHGRVESIEAQPVPGATLEQLDLARVRQAAAAAGFGQKPVESYLVARRLAAWRGAQLVVNQAALLLFAKEPHFIAHPNASVRILVVDGTEHMGGRDLNTRDLTPQIEGALPDVIERAYDAIAKAVSRPKLHDLFFREASLYPTFAWQEALVNAVAHRDYRVQTRCVEVWLYTDRMEIVSPGQLLPEISLARLQRRERHHASRNPLMARVLTELGLMRQQGEGIPRIFDEVERAWQRLPELRADDWSFTVVLHNEPIFDLGDTEWARTVRAMAYDDRQKRALVAFADRTFGSGDYQELNRVDRDIAYRELHELVQAGLLTAPELPGRGATYRLLKPAPSAVAPGAMDERDKLVELIAELVRIRNADYQQAFGVTSQAAKRALSRLVTAGVLHRSGERRGTTYSCGPLWDKWVADAQSVP